MTQNIFSLSSVNCTTGVALSYGEKALRRAISVGDMNGDGLEDAIFLLSDMEKASVLYGSNMLPCTIDLSLLNGQNGFIIEGKTPDNWGGKPAAGDINGDGYSDIVIGFGQYNGSRVGYVAVIYGGPNLPAFIDLANLSSSAGVIMTPGGENAGLPVAVGDINDDGFDDIIVGTNLGQSVRVVFGSASLPATINLGSLGSSGLGFSISSSNYIGSRPAVLGDINGDGYNDFAFSEQNGGSKVYIVYGADSFPNSFGASSLNGSNGFIVTGTGDMAVLSTISQDLTGDGLPDFMIGNHGNAVVYLIPGSDSFAASFSASSAAILTMYGASGSKAGHSVTMIDDVSGDDRPELVIGAPGAKQGYLVYWSGSLPSSITLTDIDESTGLIFSSQSSIGFYEKALATTMDLNNDGYPDLVFGAGGSAIIYPNVILGVTLPTTTTTTTTTTGTTTIDDGCTRLSEVSDIFIKGNVTMAGVVNIGIAGDYGLQFTNGTVTTAYDAQEACETEEILYIGSPDGSGEITAADCISNCTDPEISVPGDFDKGNFCIGDDLGVMELVAALPDGFGC